MTAAEQLADELCVFATWRDDYTGTLARSAAELRRLAAENAALRSSLFDLIGQVEQGHMAVGIDKSPSV